MPIKKSAIKHLRQTKQLTVRNNKVKRDLREFVKSVRQAVAAKDKKKLNELAPRLQKVIDKAAQARVIKIGTASRKKSRLMSQVNVVLASK